MDEFDEKDLEGAGMHIEGDHVIDELGDDDMDPETGLPKKKPVVIPDAEEEEGEEDLDDDTEDEDGLM